MSLHSAAVAAGNELPRIGEGMEKIIRPLEQIKGIEAFQANLRDVSVGIIVGILHDIREVEVALVSSGRVSDRPMPILSELVLTSLSGAHIPPKFLRDFKV